MRETYKDFTHEIEGKEMRFRVQKLDALHGAWLMKFAAEKILPAINGAEEAMQALKMKAKEAANSGDDKGEEGAEAQKKELQGIQEEGTKDVINLIVSALENISEEELIHFMGKCLQSVKCDLPAGWRPVMTGPSSFGVSELEYDVAGCLALCMDVIEVNLSGFFGGSLSALTQRFRNSSQQGA